MSRIGSAVKALFGAKILTKSLALKLQDGLDFIPDGDSVEAYFLRWEETSELDLYQCCQQTGDDPQSGPYYCGKIAELVAVTPDGYVGLCTKHQNIHSEKIKQASSAAKDSLHV